MVRFKFGILILVNSYLLFAGMLFGVWSIAFSPDGTKLASVADDNIVRIWDLTTKECLQELKGHTLSVVKVAFNHQGNLLASCGQDETIRLWSSEQGESALKRLRFFGDTANECGL